MNPSPTRTRTPLALGTLAAALYFSEGLPYGIVNDLIPVYLRFHHVELASIGYLNLVRFAWVFKFACGDGVRPPDCCLQRHRHAHRRRLGRHRAVVRVRGLLLADRLPRHPGAAVATSRAQ